MGPIEFQSQPNLAFETIFQDILSLNVTKGDKVAPPHKETTGSDFPINLTLPFNTSTKINTLQEAHSIFTKRWDKRMSKNNSDFSYILTDHYQKQISQIRDLIDENHKEQFLASHYSEIFATTALATTLVNMFLLFKVFKDHHKLKVLTAPLSMIKSSNCLSLSEPDSSPLPGPASSPQVICYDPVVSGLLTFLSTISVAIIIYQNWKGRNLCRGYLYSNIVQIKLIVGITTHYIPLKLRKLTGQPQRMTINTLPHPSQIRLFKNWIWDTLVIDWMDIEITNEGEPVGLPNTIIVPLRAKFRMKSMMRSDFHVNLALCQDNTWYDLTANSRAPIHRPVERIRNTHSQDTSPYVMVNNPNRPSAFNTVGPKTDTPLVPATTTPAPLQPRTLDFRAIEADVETAF